MYAICGRFHARCHISCSQQSKMQQNLESNPTILFDKSGLHDVNSKYRY